MSLLANVNQPNDKGYYFALDTTPGNAVVEAQAFVATGGAEVGPVGTFTAVGNAVPGGDGMFIMETPAGYTQWAIGVNAVPAGANSGNNLTFFGYDDSGTFLSAPMSIQRDIGEVQITNLNAGTVLVPGTLTVNNVIVGGDISGYLQSQTDFAFQASAALPAVLPAGVTNYNVGAVFQLPATGLYLVDGALVFNASAGADTFVCAPGDYISISLQPQPVAPGILAGGVDIDVVPVPASGAQTDRSFSNCVVDKLTGSYNYQAIATVHNFSGTMAATGGATLTAGIDIAALV